MRSGRSAGRTISWLLRKLLKVSLLQCHLSTPVFKSTFLFIGLCSLILSWTVSENKQTYTHTHPETTHSLKLHKSNVLNLIFNYCILYFCRISKFIHLTHYRIYATANATSDFSSNPNCKNFGMMMYAFLWWWRWKFTLVVPSLEVFLIILASVAAVDHITESYRQLSSLSSWEKFIFNKNW